MAEAPDDELNFSDIDSDDEGDGQRNLPLSRPVIAHKEIRVQPSPTSPDQDNETEFEPISPPQEKKDDSNAVYHATPGTESDFEPVSPADSEDEENKSDFYPISPSFVDDDNADNGPISPTAFNTHYDAPGTPPEGDDQFEPISPPNSPGAVGTETASSQFENISDDENDSQSKTRAPYLSSKPSMEPNFSPVIDSVLENEVVTYNDESSNDSGYQIVQKHTSKIGFDDISQTEIQKDQPVLPLEGTDDYDVDAPIPSPFSDIGDVDDMSGAEDNIINDILRDQNFDMPDASAMCEVPGTTSGDSSQDLQGTSLQLSPKDGEGEYPSNESEELPNDMFAADDQEGMGEDVGGLIADIFGDSDDEEEDFEGFADEELLPEKPKEAAAESDEESDFEPTVENKENKKVDEKAKQKDESSGDEQPPERDFISDFDLMLKKRKEMNQSKRKSRKDDVDVSTDSDEVIAAMLVKMKEAAEEDRILNQCGKAATKKLKLLGTVLQHLKKADLQDHFIDAGILPAIKDWLSPLPDNSLPHIQIRKGLLRALTEFPPLEKGALKLSGIGRAVMLLYKHPKEQTENRKVAGKIIALWSRPIFNINTNFKEMSREDREDRERQSAVPEKRRRLSEDKAPEDESMKARKPGDKGWVGRARVPMPSNRDYLARPVSTIEVDISKIQKSTLSRFDKQQRKNAAKRTVMKGGMKAIGVSLNGTKLAL